MMTFRTVRSRICRSPAQEETGPNQPACSWLAGLARGTLRAAGRLYLWSIVLAGVGYSGHCWAQVDARLTDIMYLDPALSVGERHLVLPERLRRPWLAALDRPEVEVRRIAIDSIAMAHQLGMKDWDTVIGRLVELLQAETTDPTIRRAAANTLVTLDARQEAEALFKVAQGTHLDLAQSVEPALARWDYAPAKQGSKENHALALQAQTEKTINAKL